MGFFFFSFFSKIGKKEIVLIPEILLKNKGLLEPEVVRTGYWEAGVGSLKKEGRVCVGGWGGQQEAVSLRGYRWYWGEAQGNMDALQSHQQPEAVEHEEDPSLLRVLSSLPGQDFLKGLVSSPLSLTLIYPSPISLSAGCLLEHTSFPAYEGGWHSLLGMAVKERTSSSTVSHKASDSWTDLIFKGFC